MSEQEMSVHDKSIPALGPTEEAQDMSRLDRVVVPPPAYVDPTNPAAESGSINMQVSTHPLNLSDDYGADVQPGTTEVQSTVDLHAREMAQVHTGGETEDLPENRDEWQKKHWQQRATQLGLHTSGNLDAVKDRVEEREAAIEESKNLNAGDWQEMVSGAENVEELDEVRQLYTASGADYVTVSEALDRRQQELSA